MMVRFQVHGRYAPDLEEQALAVIRAFFGFGPGEVVDGRIGYAIAAKPGVVSVGSPVPATWVGDVEAWALA